MCVILICFHDEFSGLGFLTSLVFIFLVGIFVSSWVGSTIFWVGEWFIKKMPFVRHIYIQLRSKSALRFHQVTYFYTDVLIPKAMPYPVPSHGLPLINFVDMNLQQLSSRKTSENSSPTKENKPQRERREREGSFYFI